MELISIWGCKLCCRSDKLFYFLAHFIMNAIDQLTLQLLTSKKRYNSYLANANPEKSAEIDEYHAKLKKNIPRIKTMIGRYLEDPETQTSNDIDEAMEHCFKILIRHFEMLDYEEKCAKNGYDMTDSSEDEYDKGEEEDGEEEQLDDDNQEDDREEEEKPPKPPNSFWGKNISKTNTLDHFIKKK